MSAASEMCGSAGVIARTAALDCSGLLVRAGGVTLRRGDGGSAPFPVGAGDGSSSSRAGGSTVSGCVLLKKRSKTASFCSASI
jgi:hypothetical protein